MTPSASQLALGRALQIMVEEHGTTAKALSKKMGFHLGQLTLVFAGRRPMRVSLVFSVFEHLGASPERFFWAHYPLGGAAQVALRKALKGPALGGMALSEAARRQRLRKGVPRTPEMLTAKLGEVLKRLIRSSPFTQREVAERLRVTSSSLGQALRGNSELNFTQVFGVAEAIGRTPARIFAELFGPEPADPMAEIELGLELDHQEELLRALAEGTLAQSKKAAVSQPAPSKAQPVAARANKRKPKGHSQRS